MARYNVGTPWYLSAKRDDISHFVVYAQKSKRLTYLQILLFGSKLICLLWNGLLTQIHSPVFAIVTGNTLLPKSIGLITCAVYLAP